MESYRVYRIDWAGTISAGEWVDAASEAEARRKALALCDRATSKVELWQGSRFVCELPCDGDGLKPAVPG